MVSAISPWAGHPSVLEPRTHLVPVSHGEGRVVMDGKLAQELFAAGQVFAQYAGEDALPATAEPDNPNGSAYAIEGMTSPDGRVLGKMGHSERTIGTDKNGASRDLLRNVVRPERGAEESTCQNIFAAGVSYFA